MKKFLIKIILVLFPTLFLVMGVNYYGDAANLFSKAYEEQIAKALKSGYNVSNIANFDERLLQKHIIDSASCSDVVVIGSSRTMLINSEYFKNKTLLNNSVSGASLQDLLGVYEIYEKNKCLPKHIILGLDPWTLNSNNGQTRWKTLEHEYLSIYAKLKNKKQPSLSSANPESKYLQLISPSYFQASIKKLNKTDIVLTKNSCNSTFTKLADGSITYDEKFRNSSPAEIDALVNDYLNKDIYSIENFDEISPELNELLEKFISLLREKNIRISIILTPYHPKVYSVISSKDKYKEVIKSEKIYISLAAKYNIEIIGSFNPAVLKMDHSYFYDGMHLKGKGIQKLLGALKQ